MTKLSKFEQIFIQFVDWKYPDYAGETVLEHLSFCCSDCIRLAADKNVRQER